MGGLLDTYRDFALRIYLGIKNVSSNNVDPSFMPPQLKVVLGPWKHSWPEDSNLNPKFNGRADAVRWFNKWLRPANPNDTDLHLEDEVECNFFMRDYVPPSEDTTVIPGEWRSEVKFPPESLQNTQYFLTNSHTLQTNDTSISSIKTNFHSLRYKATVGTEMGIVGADMTPNMASMDKDCLTYDSQPFKTTNRILGFPKVSLLIKESCYATCKYIMFYCCVFYSLEI